MNPRRMLRLSSLLLGVVVLATTAAPIPSRARSAAGAPPSDTPQAAARGAGTLGESQPRLTPADLPDGVPLTISVLPARAPAGQAVSVSGQAAPGVARVRLGVVSGGMMIGIRDVDADSAGRYAASVPIGGTYPPGPVQLCALALGSATAETACADLLVEPAPPGAVQGRLPLPSAAAPAAALSASVRLMDAAGSVLYSAPLRPDGTFSISDVAPGRYLYAVAGVTPTLAEMGTVQVEPLKDSVLVLSAQRRCGVAELNRKTTALSANASRAAFVRKARYNGLFSEYVDVPRPFGLYVSGVFNQVLFTASPQSTAPVEKVLFDFFGPNGQVLAQREAAGPSFAVSFNVGELPPSAGGQHPFVSVTPVVGGQEQCPSLYDIEVIADPMASPYMQPFPTSSTVWDPVFRAYRFEGMIPYVAGALPAEQILANNVPFLGTIRNRFNAGLAVKGSFDLEGQARLFMAEARSEAVFLSLPVLNPGSSRLNVTPQGMEQVAFDIRNPAGIAIPYGPLELFREDIISIPFTKIPVFTLFGILNAYVGGGVDFSVGLYLEGVVRPFQPAVDTTMSGVGSFRAELGLSVDLLFGLVEAGAGLGGEICAGVPLRITVADQPRVFFDNPFIGGRLYLVVWVSAFWGLVEDRATATIASFGRGCPGKAVVAGLEPEPGPPIPDVFASPAVSTSPGGRVLSAYVENTAPPGATPQVQVMARFQDPQTGAWGPAEALSAPGHSAQHPSVAFIGPNQTPVAVWAENTLSAAEAAAIGRDDSERDAATQMGHLEIVYALWNDGWSAPIALTDDALGDGLPDLAGTQAAGVLAWTRDTDGDAGTRGDQRIAVSRFNLATQRFDPPALLSGAGGGLNADVSVAYSASGVAVVAWVHDADADLGTSADRRLAVALSTGGEWALLPTAALPAGVDSPAVSTTPEGIRVAFLVREPSAEGEAGLVGTNGALWSALFNGRSWAASPVRDGGGAQVFAEQPALDSAGGESLLVFRRFGDSSYTSGLGQLSMSRMVGSAAASPPIYLTDSPAQQWLPALSLSPVTGRALVLHSTLSAGAAQARGAAPEPLASVQALPAAGRAVLKGGGAPVAALTIEEGADPALDPLQVSRRSPQPGAGVAVTVTVRNVGRGAAEGIGVSLYRGSPEAGTRLAEASVPTTLAFNQASTLVLQITVPDTFTDAGELPLVAQLTTTGPNLTDANDSAAITLGGLSAPSRVRFGGENALFEGALDLAWSGNVGEYVSGYRVYRSATATGPWELVGESAVPAFTDTSAAKPNRYCYAVQAYNQQGALSPYGEAECELFDDPAGVFLPLVGR